MNIKNLLTHPMSYAIRILGNILPDMPDTNAFYLKVLYRYTMKKKLNLKDPQRYNEKMQWLKLHDRNPEYIKMVDKYEAKKYVADKIGESYIIPTLGVWDRFDDIDFESLPQQFVLKCTHDSGGVVVVKDKKDFDVAAAKKLINRHLKRNYFWHTREYPYKDIKPRIIAEQYMIDESGTELKDYKFLTFSGKVKTLFVATDREKGVRYDFYDTDFNHLPLNEYENAGREIAKPAGFEEMKVLSEKLSAGIPHLRVDFYDINGKVYFGELTFYHLSGMEHFEPEEWDYTFGEWLQLPGKENV